MFCCLSSADFKMANSTTSLSPLSLVCCCFLGTDLTHAYTCPFCYGSDLILWEWLSLLKTPLRWLALFMLLPAKILQKRWLPLFTGGETVVKLLGDSRRILDASSSIQAVCSTLLWLRSWLSSMLTRRRYVNITYYDEIWSSKTTHGVYRSA